MKTRVLLGAAAAIACVLPQVAGAVSPTSAEMGEARRWVAAKFEGLQEKREPQVGLYVLANLNAVQLNARNSKETWLGDMELVDSREAGFDTRPFFSFVYGGQDSSKLLGSWRHAMSCRTPTAINPGR